MYNFYNFSGDPSYPNAESCITPYSNLPTLYTSKYKWITCVWFLQRLQLLPSEKERSILISRFSDFLLILHIPSIYFYLNVDPVLICRVFYLQSNMFVNQKSVHCDTLNCCKILQVKGYRNSALGTSNVTVCVVKLCYLSILYKYFIKTNQKG